MEIKRSEVFIHDGNLITLAGNLVYTDKKYYALEDEPHRVVYELQPDGTGKRICRVYDLIDDTNPFPPLQAEPTQDTPVDRARDAALREVIRADIR